MPGLSVEDGGGSGGNEVTGIGSLSPLPSSIRAGLTAISFFGLLSFFSSLSLFIFLCHRLLRWRKKSQQAYNQFVILIMNLLLADIQQSVAFLLNVQWVAHDGVDVKSLTCTAQGWFVSTGDLASGVWCFTIAAHTMGSILFNMRLPPRIFYAVIAVLWLFVYTCAIASVGLHPHIYVRAGAWCWINEAYPNVRLYLHYMWIFMAELGVAIVYTLMYLILARRIRQGFYRSEAMAKRARDVAKLMAVYPLVYVLCTLPLATARTASMAGRDIPMAWLLCAGAMITSNGWLDVLLYAATRRILIFSDEPPPEDCGIQTFAPLRYSAMTRFGTNTEITAAANQARAKRHGNLRPGTSAFLSPKASETSWKTNGSEGGGWNVSQSETKAGRLGLASRGSRRDITVTVTRENARSEDLEEMELRIRSDGNIMTAPLRKEDHMALEFESKPRGI